SGWMNSPDHKKNILGDYTELGVACVLATNGDPYWCVDFAKPRNDVALDPQEASDRLVEGINLRRGEAKLQALRRDARLEAVARGISRDSAARAAGTEAGDAPKPPRSADRRADEEGYEFRALGTAQAEGMTHPSEVAQALFDNPQNKK